LRLTAIELAIDRDLAAGRHREVVGELETLVAQEPLRERLHAQRMLALYRCGRQSDALDAYRRARRALVEAIGVEPGPELRRMQEAILRQDPSLEAPAQQAIELPPELDAGTPLAGRAAELDWLREHWRAVHAGAGRSVLVAGERGIGKTRLAAELAGEVHRDHGTVLYASGAGPPATARAALDNARAGRHLQRAGKTDIARPSGIPADGETRTRTGDFTILKSRVLLPDFVGVCIETRCDSYPQLAQSHDARIGRDSGSECATAADACLGRPATARIDLAQTPASPGGAGVRRGEVRALGARPERASAPLRWRRPDPHEA
jgi:Bacterial transcriptional activator domain/AAA ATPase domain